MRVFDATKSRPSGETKVSEILTADKLEQLGYTRFAADFLVIRLESGVMAVAPKNETWRRRVWETIGLHENERMLGFPTAAFTAVFATPGQVVPCAFRRKPNSRIYTVVPHPAVMEDLEKNGLINIEARPANANITFEPKGEHWTARLGGVVVVAVKGWRPEANTAYNNLWVRPALSASLMIAGPEEMMKKIRTCDLAFYDEDVAAQNALEQFSFAQEFYVLGNYYTPFELFGGSNAIAESMVGSAVIDVNEFKKQIDTVIKNGERWLVRTLLAMLHTDRLGTGLEQGLHHFLDKAMTAEGLKLEGEAETIVKEAIVGMSFPELTRMCEESLRQAQEAMDWLKKWKDWAPEEIKRRARLGVKFGLPATYNGRKPRQQVLADIDAVAVAAQVVEWVYAQVARKRHEIAELQTPPAAAEIKPTGLTQRQLRLMAIVHAKRDELPAPKDQPTTVPSPAPTKPVAASAPKEKTGLPPGTPINLRTHTDKPPIVTEALVERPRRRTGPKAEALVETDAPPTNPIAANLSPDVAAKLAQIAADTAPADKPKRVRKPRGKKIAVEAAQ